MSFATVISVTKRKQVVKLLGIPEGKYSQTFQSRLAGDKWLNFTRMFEQNARKRN
jgi:protoheme ferro-lyase